MPRRGHDGIFALGTIDGEEVQRLVVGVVQAYRHDDVADTQVGPLCKRLLKPELFQFYLAAFLYFLFPLATFLVFFLIGQAVAAVFKLNLRTKRPAPTEVVA